MAFLPFYMAFYFKPFVNLATVHFTSGREGGGLLGFEGGGGHEKTYGLKGGHWKISSNFAVTAFVITQTAFQNVKNQCSWHSESSDFPGEACPWTPYFIRQDKDDINYLDLIPPGTSTVFQMI